MQCAPRMPLIDTYCTRDADALSSVQVIATARVVALWLHIKGFSDHANLKSVLFYEVVRPDLF